MDFALETGAHHRGGHGDRRARRSCRPTWRSARRSKPRTSSCCRSRAATRSASSGLKAGVHRRQLQQPRLRRPRQRRLQHQRQPLRREQHHDRRRDGDPHAVVRRDHRHPERRRGPGSAGPDRRTTCPSTAARAAGRSASSPRAAATATRAAARSSPRRALQANTGRATAARTRSRTAARRRSTTSSTATPSAARSGRVVQGQAVLLRRAGVGRTSSRSQTNTATVPTEAMRRGDFSELLDPEQRVLHRRAQIIRDPLTGQPFPGNIIPPNRLSAERPGAPEHVSRCRRRASGRAPPTLISDSENPQDQRKDNIRLDYRLNDSNQLTYRYSGYNWVGDRRVPRRRSRSRAPTGTGRTPRRRRAGRARSRTTWSTRSRYTLLARRSVHQRVHRERASTSAAVRHQLSVHLPGTRRSRTRSRRSRSPASARSTAVRIRRSRAARSTRSRTRRRWSRAATRSRRGVVVEYSGEDDFDQINVARRSPAAPTTRTAGSSSATAVRRHRARRSPTRRSACSATTPRSASARLTKWRALATDVFVQDSWKPTQQADRSKAACAGCSGRRGTRRPTTSPTSIRAFYDPANAGGDQSVDRAARRRRLATTAIVLPGDGFRRRRRATSSWRTIRRVQALFRGEPRGFSKTHTNAFEPRLRHGLRDERQDGRPGERRRVPQPRHAQRLDAARRQPAVPAAGHVANGIGRQSRRRHGGATTCRSA